MVIDKVNDCCNFALAALDGVYGWATEAVAIIIFVVIFNFFAKWILKSLHKRFEKQKKTWPDSFVQALYLPLSYFVWFFAGLQTIDLIANRLDLDFNDVLRHNIAKVGGILIFAWFLMRWKKMVVRRMITRSKSREITIDQGKIGAIDKLLTVTIAFLTTLILLEATDRSVNTLIAFGGVGGLALAFASQEIIANFFGGFMIYLTQPFTIGDWIQIPDHSIEGYVEEIGWYMTRVRSLDKRPIYIPNSIFSKLIVITPSRMSHRQIKETIGVRYEDISKIKPITDDIREMLQQHLEIDRSQPILVRLSAFGNYAIDITVIAYSLGTDTDSYMKVKEDVLFRIAAIVEKHGAEMAMPTQNIAVLSQPIKST